MKHWFLYTISGQLVLYYLCISINILYICAFFSSHLVVHHCFKSKVVMFEWVSSLFCNWFINSHHFDEFSAICQSFSSMIGGCCNDNVVIID